MENTRTERWDLRELWSAARETLAAAQEQAAAAKECTARGALPDGAMVRSLVEALQRYAAQYQALQEAGVPLRGNAQEVEEFLDACEKIKAIGKTPLYYSGSDSWTLQCFTHFGFNKEVLDSGLTYTEFWNEMNTNKRHYSECQDFADAIVRSKEMIEKGYVQETYLSDSYDMAQTALAEGEAGMYVNDTGVIDEIASKYPDLVENIGAFPLPLYDEAEN